MSTIFTWKSVEMEQMLATCERDEVLKFIHKYLSKDDKLLESGCGTGRYVKYLHDRGWKIVGLEYSKDTVDMVKSKWPEINIFQGDAANSQFQENEFGGIISLGVVEHFFEGPKAPLMDMYRTLKPGGIAIITVPCFSKVRQFKKMTWLDEIFMFPYALALGLFRKKKMKLNRFGKEYIYNVYPSIGEFFEYRMTPNEFIKEVRDVGFEILESVPIAHIDGLYHDLNLFKLLVKFKNWEFKTTKLADIINKRLKKYPFFHNHMHALIVRK